MQPGAGRSFRGGTLEQPAFDFVFVLEPELLINRPSRRRGIKLDGPDADAVEVFDSFFQQARSNSPPAKFRIDEHHPDPRKTLFVDDGCRRAHHLAIDFRRKASARARLQKTPPVGRCLVPSCQVLQPHPGGNVGACHGAKIHTFGECVTEEDSVSLSRHGLGVGALNSFTKSSSNLWLFRSIWMCTGCTSTCGLSKSVQVSTFPYPAPLSKSTSMDRTSSLV